MKDVIGLPGRRVLVTGRASGMGQETERLLLDLDAEVHELDFHDCTLPLAR